jgi:hypothetical protein
MKGKSPDFEINIESTDNEIYKLNFYRRLDPEYSTDTLVYDKNYLWSVKQDGEVVRMQYYTVGPLIEGQTVFVDNSVNN